MSAESGARLAVIEWLCQPKGELVHQKRSTNGWISEVRAGGGGEADASKIRFVKSLRSGSTELHAVEFVTTKGDRGSYVVGVGVESDRAWRVTGAAGGGGSDPPRDHPWVNLGGWGWPDHGFRAGGRVVGTGNEAAEQVRLTFKNRVQLEDEVTAERVLFSTDESVELPARVEVLDGTGRVVGSHLWPGK